MTRDVLRAEVSFPMPGDTLDRRTVIASVWLIDAGLWDRQDLVPEGSPDLLALVMLLNDAAPFYTVGQVEFGDDGWALTEGASTDHFNINHATEDFANSGGDV